MQSAATAPGAVTPSKLGRPSEYRDIYPAEAYEQALLGATDVELGAHFGVDERTINRWKHDHPEFGARIRAGKSQADAEVAASLFKRATGYDLDGKHIPGDTTACIFWLKNRRPRDWRDKVELTGADGAPLIPEASDLELARRVAELLSRPSLAGPVIDQPTESPALIQETHDGSTGS